MEEIDTALQALVIKLGHPLGEIRGRALSNIMSKLEYGIISENHLISKLNCVPRLIDWFNFPSPIKKKEVLELILKLAQDADGATAIAACNGMDALLKLRNENEPSLQLLIDGIRERVFDETRSSWSNDYQKHSLTDYTAIPRVEISNAAVVEIPDDVYLVDNAIPPTSTDSFPNAQLPSQQTQENYFDDIMPASFAARNAFRFVTFPWIPLTNSDTHVLESTNQSLENEDYKEVTNICTFLRNVVFQDFPAEIFLQRPQIFHTLTSLLNASEVTVVVLTEVLYCLQVLTAKLKSRVKFYLNPATYNLRPGSNVTTNNASTRESQISSSGGSSVMEHLEPRQASDGVSDTLDSEIDAVEKDVQLQLLQITVPEFCMHILNCLLPLYASNDCNLLAATTQVVCLCIDLTNLSFKEIWNKPGALVQCVTEKSWEIFNQIANLLCHHISKVSNDEEKSNHFHRLCYLHLSIVSIRFLNAVVHPSQVADAHLPKPFIDSLTVIMFDPLVVTFYPQLHSMLVEYMRCLDEHSFHTYEETLSVCDSMKSACQFFKNINQDKDTLMKLAEESLLSLPYTKSTRFIERFVHVLSESYCKQSCTDDILNEEKDILIKLMTHKSQLVRITTYRTCHSLVKKVKDSSLSPSSPVRFLLDPIVLRTICISGFCDANSQVVQLTRELVLHVIQCATTIELRNHLMISLIPVLPILQGFADTLTSFGRCVTFLTEVETSVLPRIDLLRGNIRLMFCSDSRLRCNTFPQLAWFLTNEENSHEKTPDIYQSDFSSMSKLLIPEMLSDLAIARVVDYSTMTKKYEDLKNVLDILSDSDMDIIIKKQAVQQIAQMIEDPRFHQYFIDQKGINLLLNFTASGLKKYSDSLTAQEAIKSLPFCFRILLLLLMSRSHVRRDLRDNEQLYFQLLRGALLLMNDLKTHMWICTSLALLVFEEFIIEVDSIPPKEGGDFVAQRILSFPPVITNKYKLPFKITQQTDPQISVAGNDSSFELVSIYPVKDMLRVMWNIQYYGDNLNALQFNTLEPIEDFSNILRLTLVDQQIFAATHLVTAIEKNLHQMSAAKSHEDVYKMLAMVKFQLIAASFHIHCQTLHTMSWKASFSRFLYVVPTTKADKKLFSTILAFMKFLITENFNHLTNEIKNWIKEVILDSTSALNSVLTAGLISDVDDESKSVNKEMVTLLAAVTTALPSRQLGNSNIVDVKLEIIIGFLLRLLSQTEAPHFYNLASLEAIIKCLMHVTANPGWSVCNPISAGERLRRQILFSLMDVIGSFQINSGRTSNSVMGKGITHSATLCLQHLVKEMETQETEEKWVQQWLYPNSLNTTGDGESLMWLVPLWTYKDPEVSSGSLGIAVGLSSTSYGCSVLMTSLHHIAGGAWGAALSFLLDHGETNCVKEQAALLLVNLTSYLLTSRNGLDGQGIPVEDDEVSTQVNDLRTLLQHSNFYHEVTHLISCFISCSFEMSTLQRESVNTEGDLSVTGDTYEFANDVSMIVTSTVISAICKLLHNLVLLIPNETLTAVKDYILATFFRYFTTRCLFSRSDGELSQSIEVADLLNMRVEMFNLLTSCVLKDTDIQMNVLQNPHVLKTLINLLDVQLERRVTSEKVYMLWSQLYRLLIALSQSEDSDSVVINIRSNLQLFIGNVKSALSAQTVEEVWVNCLKLLAVICNCKLPNDNLKQSLDAYTGRERDSTDSCGSLICQLILTKYKGRSSESLTESCATVIIALRSLLRISNTAKLAAIEGDLVNLAIEEMKELHLQFTLVSFGNSPTNRKLTTTMLQQRLILHFDLLNAFMQGCNTAKLTCSERGLSAQLHQLWHWCFEYPLLMSPLLSLLCTYTANCETSARSVAYTDPSKGIGAPKTLGNRSLVHAVVRLAGTEATRFEISKDFDRLQLLFDILANLCAANECRSIIIKLGFLDSFSKLSVERSKKTKHLHALDSAWLNFVIRLTLFGDGRDTVIRLPGAVSQILDFVERGFKQNGSLALLALRNLCFSSANKSHLLNSEHVLRILMEFILREESDTQLIAASALWALIANCQKAKTMLRSGDWLQRLHQHSRLHPNTHIQTVLGLCHL